MRIYRIANKYGYCLDKAIELWKKDPSLVIMMGPPGREEDTAHFWCETTSGEVIDPANDVVPENYPYEGRQVDLSQFRNILEDILYGLENFPELESKPERLSTLRPIENPVIQEMVDIWESGHGVLSKPERIEALRGLV